jgi:hypothetical protein
MQNIGKKTRKEEIEKKETKEGRDTKRKDAVENLQNPNKYFTRNRPQFFSESSAIISMNSIKQLIVIIEKRCVFFEIRTIYLSVV